MGLGGKKRSILVSVLYQPPLSFQNRIQVALNAGWSVLVFDNGPERFEGSALNLTVLGAESNRGLGYALCESMKWAYKQGYEYAFYVDQDTIFNSETLDHVSHSINSLESINEPWAAVGFSAEGSSNWISVPLLINAGTMFHLPSLKQLGWHNPKRFLECVDYDFCLKARQAGFVLGQIGACPGFDHLTEQPKHGVGRLYSAARTCAFILSLFSLAFSALRLGPRRYAWIFIRNIATHLGSQAWVWWHFKTGAS